MATNWHCEKVKNITVSLDDEVHRRARIVAAERGTSLSALVKQFLEQLGSGESESDRLRKAESTLRMQVKDFRAADRLSRDALHDRSA
jgi:plasmid stability protein